MKNLNRRVKKTTVIILTVSVLFAGLQVAKSTHTSINQIKANYTAQLSIFDKKGE